MVIGAQKSGTTTLYQILRDHPCVALPPHKEAPFFSNPTLTMADWESSLTERYGAIAEGARLGQCSPHYLATPGTAERAHAAFPECRIIAILRDPVERTYSHYKMCRRRGQTDLDFAQKVDEWLRPAALARARTLPMADANEADCCVVWSEYARQLKPWIEAFGSDRVEVYFLSDLEKQPYRVIGSILESLDLDRDWTSEKIGQTFFKGSAQTKMSRFRWLKKIGPVDRVWRLFLGSIPLSYKFTFQQWNETSDASDAQTGGPDAVTQQRLKDHFANDSEQLCELGFRPPWLGKNT